MHRPFILRIDYKYNPVAHGAPTASFKQYGFEIFKFEKY
jgi:hypothetical protein